MSAPLPLPASAASAPALDLQDLSVEIATRSGAVQVLNGLSLQVGAGEVLGLIGESGAGKSLCALALMGLLPEAARVTSGRMLFQGREVDPQTPPEAAGWRARRAAMIFQSPRAALNPLRRVGVQIADVLARHQPAAAAREIRARALALLHELHLPQPRHCLRAYPHQLSGGQCQRIGIALALASDPRLLVADEPATGLDPTTAAAVMAQITGLVQARGLGLLLITHDLPLAARHCHRLAILHAGQLVEVGPAAELLARPRHPYTAALLRAAPAFAPDLAALAPIPGTAPDLAGAAVPACRFTARCPRALPRCHHERPALRAVAEGAAPAHRLACHNPL